MSTIRSDSHEVCGGQRVLQVCELAVREAVALGTGGVLHISQELPSVLHAEKFFFGGMNAFRFYVETCMSLCDRKDFEACTW